MWLKKALSCFVVFFAAAAAGGPFLDPLKHDIFLITAKNFASVIGKFRSNQVAAILFCDSSKGCQTLLDGTFNEIGKELRGMVKIGAIDCSAWPKFCSEYVQVDVLPKVVIFPPHPVPHTIYEGEISKKMIPTITRHIPKKHVTEVSSANIDVFLAGQAAVPKALLFSNKEKSPTIFNALATTMEDRIMFGFVKDESLRKRFGVNDVPKLVVVRSGKKNKHETYTGDMKFQPMHEWLNARSETFVKGGGFSDDDSPAVAVKPWMIESLPEMTRDSYQDICFKHEALCAIFLKDGKALSADENNMLEELKAQFAEKQNFKWMWMDVGQEKEYSSLFQAEAVPTVVVVKSQKKRFTQLENHPATKDSISNMIEKILGGDARFKKMGNLPQFTVRKDEL